MELEIWHSTRYEFSDAVFLEPHVLRFQPRADGGQTPLEFSLDVDPVPAGTSAALDAAGNTVTHVWFDGLHRSLTITARAVVEMLRDNPFDFLPDHCRSRLPVFYAAESDALRPYLHRNPHGVGEPDQIAIFASRMRDAARGELAPLLTSLNNTIYDRFETVRRAEPGVWSPERTWRENAAPAGIWRRYSSTSVVPWASPPGSSAGTRRRSCLPGAKGASSMLGRRSTSPAPAGEVTILREG
jgi:transglutaminase-like putative cysteine protease